MLIGEWPVPPPKYGKSFPKMEQAVKHQSVFFVVGSMARAIRVTQA
jgi:hypothetical protein